MLVSPILIKREANTLAFFYSLDKCFWLKTWVYEDLSAK
jgi:hypothetical protein